MFIEFTPTQQKAMNALQSEKYNFILYGGAIRGGKTVMGLSALLVLCSIFPKSRWCVIRENIERLRITTMPSFKKLEPSGKLKENPYEYIHPNGSVILFKGENYAIDKDLDWMKGLEVNGFLFEEINECQQQSLYKAFERAGAWIIPNAKIQPKPIILATCNPSFGWVKDLVYDKWKANNLNPNWLYIPAKITDNPHLPQAYIDSLKNLPRYEYEVFVEGNWDIQLKTGGEFLTEFELEKHVKFITPDFNNTIHVSVDSNVLPYIAVSIWQVIKDKEKYTIRQIHEIPAKDPNNTAKKAGKLVSDWLLENKYQSTVYLYGDPTTKQRNNIDDQKKSFLDLFKEPINKAGYTIEERFFYKAPPVASTGEFINAVLEGKIENIWIEIFEQCKTSINDYILCKKDVDGSIVKKRTKDPKTLASYEELGHLLDTMRYFICKAFWEQFQKYQNRFTNYAEIKEEKNSLLTGF